MDSAQVVVSTAGSSVLPPLTQPQQGLGHNYRSTNSSLLSSSPSHQYNDHDELFKSPVTPPSSPPYRGSQGRFRTTSANDPFSAAAKSELNQHPSFGREYPHVKHPGKSKRSLPPSPIIIDGGPTVLNSTPSLSFTGFEPSSSASASLSATSWRSSNASHRRSIAGSRSSNLHTLSSDSGTDGAQERALGKVFDYSDEAPTSDDHLEAVPWDQPSSDTDGGAVGLGFGQDIEFQEQGSPSAGRNRLAPLGAPKSSMKRSTYSRSSSINDPFGAFGATLPTHDHRLSTSTTSPGSGLPFAQRRRLIGTSPKKSTAGGKPKGGPATSDSDDDGGLHQLMRSSRAAGNASDMAQFWHKAVEKVYDSNDPKVDVSDGQISGIHPIVADLAKYVAIDPPRAFEPTTSTSSLPSRMDSFSRAGSSRIPFGRTSTGVKAGRTPSSCAVPTANATLQMYLANNRLQKLPSALFEVGNLRVLSLRKNDLSELPSALGQLRNLRELNIANNRLQYLPAEIQTLTLDNFHCFPNPFLKPPSHAKLEVRSIYSITGRVMAAQVITQDLEAQQFKSESAHSAEAVAGDLSDSIEAEFMALHHAEISTPGALPSTFTSMGPPALPARFIRGPAGVLSQPPSGSTALPRRIFDRTRSDAQVDDLLARGGGRMIGRQSTTPLAPSLGTMLEADRPAEDEDSIMKEPAASPRHSGLQVVRTLGHLNVIETTLPSLRELCIRRLLSPCEASVAPGPEMDADATAMAMAATRTSSLVSRPIVWTRVPSTSLAFQQQSQRPLTLLETYENGALRELEATGQLQASVISLLESARRNIEGKWGSSGNGGAIVAIPGGRKRGETDSWCKGVTGRISNAAEDEGRGGIHQTKATVKDDDDVDDADASSPGSDDGFDETIVSTSPLLHRKNGIGGHSFSMLAPPQDVSAKLDSQGDDATLNPHFNRCPNPLHAGTHALSQEAGVGVNLDASASSARSSSSPSRNTIPSSPGLHLLDYPLAPSQTAFAPLYSQPCEERIEWVSHVAGFRVLGGKSDVEKMDGASAKDHTLLPLLWRGCGKGCLRFLEE